MAQIVCGQQDLRNRVIVFGEKLVIRVHQLALTHRSRCLLACHVTRTSGKTQLAHAHADRTGRDENDLVSRVFEVGKDLAKLLNSLDIEPARGVCQRGSADLDNDFHT